MPLPKTRSILLAISDFREFSAEILADKRANPYVLLRQRWKAPDGKVENFLGIYLYPQDIEPFMENLVTFKEAMRSKDPAKIAKLPTKADRDLWLTGTHEKFFFHNRNCDGKKTALVVTFRLLNTSTPFRPREFYVFLDEVDAMLKFLPRLQAALLSPPVSTPEALPAQPLVPAIEDVTDTVAAPSTTTETALITPKPQYQTTKKEEPLDDCVELSDFETALSDRFEDQEWQELVQRKSDLERELFLEEVNEHDRRGFVSELTDVIGEMNDFCARVEGEKSYWDQDNEDD